MISYDIDKIYFRFFLNYLWKNFCKNIKYCYRSYCYGLIILFQVLVYKLLGGIINDVGDYKYESLKDFLV